MVPQPVKAIVLLFPISKQYEARRRAEDEYIAKHGQHPIDSTILWIRQTVCGFFLTMNLASVDAIIRSKTRVERWVSFTR